MCSASLSNNFHDANEEDNSPTDMSDAVLLPNSDPGVWMYKYPLFSPELLSRFENAKFILQSAVTTAPVLRAYASHISYLARKCGSSPERATPSIVVACPTHIRELLVCFFEEIDYEEVDGCTPEAEFWEPEPLGLVFYDFEDALEEEKEKAKWLPHISEQGMPRGVKDQIANGGNTDGQAHTLVDRSRTLDADFASEDASIGVAAIEASTQTLPSDQVRLRMSSLQRHNVEDVDWFYGRGPSPSTEATQSQPSIRGVDEPRVSEDVKEDDSFQCIGHPNVDPDWVLVER